MKIISHRGNINGPVLENENRPSYIDSAIKLGYDVEVDLRFIDDEFWLGHDNPQYKIEIGWMELRKEYIWYHCKDIESALELTKIDKKFKFFCHKNDDYIITSTGKLWVHNLNGKINEECIIPLLSLSDIDSYTNTIPYAICTDNIYKIKSKFFLGEI
jgi:hypothetical protein